MQEIAIVGATGVVGRELLSILKQRHFPYRSLRLFASEKSKGKRLQKIKLETLEEGIGDVFDLTFFAAGSSISKTWAPKWPGKIIDLSSHFREKVPLIIPEIHEKSLFCKEKLIASPNCVATLMALSLFPLHQKFQVKRIVAATYQAASGGGKMLLQELKKRGGRLPFPYAFNLFPHNSPMQNSGYVEEEEKIQREVAKMFDAPHLKISVTAVRVPVMRAHSLSLNVEFYNPFDVKQLYNCWEKMPGIAIFENRSENRFATPWDATGQDAVFVGRARRDVSQPNTVEFWVVADQLRKGAALNAVQIAEALQAKGAADVKLSSSLVTG